MRADFAELDIRLVPSPLWGYSVAALCTSASWAKLKSRTLALSSETCLFHESPGAHDKQIEGHERWSYNGTHARLVDIWPVCKACHAILHPGRALARRGTDGLRALERQYASRARISVNEANLRYRMAFSAHARLSRSSRWEIDLTHCSDNFPLKLKKASVEKIAQHDWTGSPFLDVKLTSPRRS